MFHKYAYSFCKISTYFINNDFPYVYYKIIVKFNWTKMKLCTLYMFHQPDVALYFGANLYLCLYYVEMYLCCLEQILQVYI